MPPSGDTLRASNALRYKGMNHPAARLSASSSRAAQVEPLQGIIKFNMYEREWGITCHSIITERSHEMEAKKKGIESTTNGSVQGDAFICSKCGQLLRHPHEWVMGENGTIICATCYKELLFPNINDHSMELFD
jgi:uncharacterized Zn-finger protein